MCPLAKVQLHTRWFTAWACKICTDADRRDQAQAQAVHDEFWGVHEGGGQLIEAAGEVDEAADQQNEAAGQLDEAPDQFDEAADQLAEMMISSMQLLIAQQPAVDDELTSTQPVEGDEEIDEWLTSTQPADQLEEAAACSNNPIMTLIAQQPVVDDEDVDEVLAYSDEEIGCDGWEDLGDDADTVNCPCGTRVCADAVGEATVTLRGIADFARAMHGFPEAGHSIHTRPPYSTPAVEQSEAASSSSSMPPRRRRRWDRMVVVDAASDASDASRPY